MKQLWDDILKARENSSKAYLATVIATEGTEPKKEGSKMLIIGGESLKGALRVLVEPVKLEPEISLQLRHALDDGTPFALLTVTRSSLPSIKPASKIMLSSSGTVYGSFGDDRLNSVAANMAEYLLSKRLSRTVSLDGSFEPTNEAQQAAVEIFVEVVDHDPDLYIFGASQVAVPVASLASQSGFRVHVVDPRPRFANRERFPTASEILVGFPGEIAREIGRASCR